MLPGSKVTLAPRNRAEAVGPIFFECGSSKRSNDANLTIIPIELEAAHCGSMVKQSSTYMDNQTPKRRRNANSKKLVNRPQLLEDRLLPNGSLLRLA